MKHLSTIFISFFQVGILTFGGGYSMLPMLRREVVEKHAWGTEEELLDWFAVGQCGPGAIAINTAALVGRKVAGVPGAAAAVLGIISPSYIIILLVAAFLSSIGSNPWVQAAFAGIRACVCALILNAACKLWKSSVKDAAALILFLAAFVGAALLDVSPILLVLGGGLFGVVWMTLRNRGGQGEGK